LRQHYGKSQELTGTEENIYLASFVILLSFCCVTSCTSLWLLSKLELILSYFADFTPLQIKQFEALDELYRDWNSKINIISRKDIDGLYEKHVLHSLSIAAVFEFPKDAQVIDIGTGGGFPGIPLAIFFPEVNFHLVDSIGKKLKVVEAVAKEIDLKNVTTQHTRAEEIKIGDLILQFPEP
jgi:16S rRNA (guanine527-N7)-methyltransferase